MNYDENLNDTKVVLFSLFHYFSGTVFKNKQLFDKNEDQIMPPPKNEISTFYKQG